MQVFLTRRQIEVLEIVFDQLCCDHFRETGPTPYNFEQEQDEFVNLLDIFTNKLEGITFCADL